MIIMKLKQANGEEQCLGAYKDCESGITNAKKYVKNIADDLWTGYIDQVFPIRYYMIDEVSREYKTGWIEREDV